MTSTSSGQQKNNEYKCRRYVSSAPRLRCYRIPQKKA